MKHAILAETRNSPGIRDRPFWFWFSLILLIKNSLFPSVRLRLTRLPICGTVFDSVNTPELASNRLIKVFLDRHGALFVSESVGKSEIKLIRHSPIETRHFPHA